MAILTPLSDTFTYGFGWGIDPVTGLSTVSTSGGLVTTVTDYGPRSRTATGFGTAITWAGANNPVAIRASGNSYLRTDAKAIQPHWVIGENGLDYSFVGVFAIPSNANTWFYYGPNGERLMFETTTRMDFYSDNQGSPTYQSLRGWSAGVGTTATLLSVVMDVGANTYTVRVNGVQVAQTPCCTTPFTINFNDSDFSYGASLGPGGYADLDIYNAQHFRKVLTATQLYEMEASAAWRATGNGNLLPVGAPYKSVAPVAPVYSTLNDLAGGVPATWFDCQVMASFTGAWDTHGQISTLNDLNTTNANNMTGSGTDKPTWREFAELNNFPAFQFQLNDQFTKSTTAGLPTGTAARTLVAFLDGTVAADNTAIFGYSDIFIGTKFTGGTANIGILHPGGTINTGIAWSGASTGDYIELVIASGASPAVTLYKNGTSVYTGNISTLSSTNAGLYCGRNDANTDLVKVGMWAIFGRALDTTDRQLSEGQIMWEWGRQASLPGGHPYLSARPVVAPAGAAVGAASGTGTALGVGASKAAAVGAAAGVGTALGVGVAKKAAVGAASGTGTALGVGVSKYAAVGAASGTGTALGVGTSASPGNAVGSATGTGTALGVGASKAAAVGAASGTGTALGVGAAKVAAVGTASGVGTALGISASAQVTAFWIKVGGAWRAGTPWINVAGVWKQATPWTKAGGTWR